MAPKRISFTAWIYLTIAILSLVEAFIPITNLILLISALIIIFVIIEFRFIPTAQKIAGGSLIIFGNKKILFIS